MLNIIKKTAGRISVAQLSLAGFLLCALLVCLILGFGKAVSFVRVIVALLVAAGLGYGAGLVLARSLRRISSESKVVPNFPMEIATLAQAYRELDEHSTSSHSELTRQDTARRELLANAAHDIKGPLTAISGYLEDCQTRLDSGDLKAAKDSLAVCVKNTGLLQRIVLEIFEAAKFDNLQGNLVLEVTSVDELLGDTVQKFQVRATKEIKKIIFKPGSQNTLIQADLGLLERAVSNLIDNALKYSEPEGHVSVGTSLSADKVLVYVSDNGKGIPERDIPHIFDRLYRVERDRSKEAKGSGFGLSIVKKIVEAHSGTIVVSSTQGMGTVFQISLPVLSRDKVAEAMAEMISKKT